MLALDWAKAFDSISPDSLIHALKRFGMPHKITQAISAIYHDRQFFVIDAGHKSKIHNQPFGISQGCPLSPFLFVILMTVLIHDAKSHIQSQQHESLSDQLACQELLYADDTLLIERNIMKLEAYMNSIIQLGKEYGLKLNWGKLEQMNVNCEDVALHQPSGDPVACKQSLKYLGAQLSADGYADSEIAQKIGRASQDFKVLKQFWNHCYIPIRFKFIVFSACILQRLLYSLEGVWLNKHLLKKLDGFYCKCLRHILKISPSFISRVSNKFILAQFNSKPLSLILLQRQLYLFGKIARMPDKSIMRSCVFSEQTIDLIKNEKRRQGRPRNTWAEELHKRSQCISNRADISLKNIILDAKSWQHHVHQYIDFIACN